MKKVHVTKDRSSKLKVSLVSALLVLGLAAGPAQADHNNHRNVFVPLATFAALTYLFSHGGHHTTYKRKSYHSYGYNNHGHNHGHQSHSRRKHSHSSGGYSHKSKRH